MEIRKRLYSETDVNMDDLLKRTALSKIIDEISSDNKFNSHKQIYNMFQYINCKSILIDLIMEDKNLQRKFLERYSK